MAKKRKKLKSRNPIAKAAKSTYFRKARIIPHKVRKKPPEVSDFD